ncbi:GNAT family N-acetyltransferase [Paenibacillus sp. NFR01]|uniref:GNAT family N-acetyltransferase n=1 Tax=Paenibacillus sp. NFR01 TaxID=1566279 RepID=UPI0008ADEC66|nr:GNAT family N-acetyltransferase [Paenibacillus sp. NFR01]SEU19498.1 Ribosomal protein S18 acetylase RimI [Paenibacillus sp. NFR01]
MNTDIRTPGITELAPILQLVHESFDEQIAPWYTPEGIQQFYKFIDARAVQERFGKDHQMFVAYCDGRLAGMIEVRNVQHISMLFIHNDFRGAGIGTSLLRHAAGYLEQLGAKTVTVNSSPNSVGFYRGNGFIPVQEEQAVHGIRFIPMELGLDGA